MNEIQFEQLPNVVSELVNELKEVKRLLLQKPDHLTDANNPQNINEIATLTGYSKPTLYGYVQRNEIPHSKKNGRLFFFKSEIIDWIKAGKQKTSKELQEETENFLAYKNNKR